jgi:proteasome lid subunit RPN8/RPN11
MPTKMALQICREQWEQLRRHGERAYPRECCGVLVGGPDEAGQRGVRRVVRCANASPEAQERHYRLSPRDLVRVQRAVRAGGLAIVGFFHSHPDHPARWSSADLAEAHWTGCSYVIISVEAGRAAETRSYLLREGAGAVCFEEEVIEIREGRKD